MAATALTVENAKSANIDIIEDGRGSGAVHEMVTAMRANRRTGTAHTKTRGEVAGHNAKPWRQKGTGRARAGRVTSPIWRGGGRTFPSLPSENFKQKVNRKMYRAGVCAILSQLAREERLVIVDDISLDSPKTKVFASKLKSMGLEESTLVITDEVTENLQLASRNLPSVLVVGADDADPVSLVRFEKVAMTQPALTKFQEMLA